MMMIPRLAAILVLLLLTFSVQAQTLLSEEALSQALVDGTLEQVISETLGDSPTPEQIAALQQALDALAANAPEAAAAAALAVVNIAKILSESNPQAAVDLVAAAVPSLTDPDVVEAAPSVVAQALANSQETISLAQTVASNSGISLTGTDVLNTEAVELAEAQATLADAAPEAGEEGADGGLEGPAADALSGIIATDSGTGGGGTASIAAP